jgi:hypothetical protein
MITGVRFPPESSRQTVLAPSPAGTERLVVSGRSLAVGEPVARACLNRRSHLSAPSAQSDVRAGTARRSLPPDHVKGHAGRPVGHNDLAHVVEIGGWQGSQRKVAESGQ